MQNGFIERFNRSYREAVLDMFVFQSLSEVREQTVPFSYSAVLFIPATILQQRMG
jgi:hypothetical protein